MKQDELKDFINRIETSSEVNKAYSELNWKDFLESNREHIRYTPRKDSFSKNSLSFIDKDSIALSFGLTPSSDSFAKHIKNADSRICTLHSSALLPLLLFYSINKKNPIKIDDTEYNQVYFEVPNKVFDKSRPSKIDVALISKSSKTVLYLESKFTEYLSGKSSNSFSEKYKLFVQEVLGEELPVEKDGNLYIRGKVGNNDIIYGEGIKQIIAHFIGVCKGGTSRNCVEETYIRSGYKVLLGSIVYKWNNRFCDYNELYKTAAKKLNNLLQNNKRIGNGSDVDQLNVNSILQGAPQEFSVIEELLTYQGVVKENKNKFNPNVLEFYKLNNND